MRNLINFAQILNNSKINIPQTPADQRTFTQVFNIVLATSGALDIIAVVTGIAAVVVIILGGLTMATSGGNTEAVANARRRVLYSLVGLVVVALAWTILTFLTNKLIKT
jgi:hypothetical protein